jgi:hypothetical protein
MRGASLQIERSALLYTQNVQYEMEVWTYVTLRRIYYIYMIHTVYNTTFEIERTVRHHKLNVQHYDTWNVQCDLWT